MYFGYRKRTGKRGDYKYWYIDETSGKFYKGLKPSDYVVRILQKEVEHPSSDQIIPCPWLNLESGNYELIETKNGVLYNKGGILDKREIDLFENYHYVLLINELVEEITIKTKINKRLIKQWHQRFLGHIYPWAGKYRTVDISKPGFRWPPPNHIERSMSHFETDLLSQTPITSNVNRVIFNLVSQIMGEFLIIHPFREGNGRISKLLGAILLLQKGFPLPDFSRISKEEFIYAALDAYAKNFNKMTRILCRVLI